MVIKTILASSLLVATPALAQTMQPAGPPDSSGTAAPATQQTAPTPAPGPADQPGQMTEQPDATTTQTTTTTSTSTETATTNDDAAVRSTIDADWAKYDANKNDALSRAELGNWLTDLQSAAGKKKPDSAYMSSAFKKADANKNGSVSKDELAAFLKS